MPKKLSIIIPAHNEAERLPAVLRSYARHFDGLLGSGVELIVVANNCSDATADKAREIAQDYPQIRVIEEDRRIGKGGAVILGAKAAQGQWIGFVDADGATPAAEFARLYEVARKQDGVIASRWLPGANVTAHQKWLRLLSSRLFNLATHVLLGLKYKDTQCGAKIFKAEAWQKILPNIGITRFAFDVDILFQLRREKFRIIEEPTEWHDVAGSKVNILGSSLEMFLAIIRMRLLYSPLKPLIRLYERTIAKPVEFLLKDPLFRHTALLTAAAMVGHVCNIAFQMIMGRRLSTAEFALLSTFLAIFAIVQRPFGTIATAMTHFASILIQEGKQALLGRLVIKWSLITAVPALVLSVVCLAFSPQIAAYFHLERVEPIIVAALALPALCVSPVFLGANAGLQQFGIASLANSIGAMTRVALAGALVCLVFAATGWALVGHVGGLYASFLIIFVSLFPMLSRGVRETQGKLPSLRFYLFWTFLSNLAAGFLSTGDIILMRRFLPEESGFAYAATLGRITIFLSASVVSAMFPKVASLGILKRQDRAVYLRAVMYTGLFLSIGLILSLAVPGLLLRVFYGLMDIDKSLLTQTRWMALIMSVVALFNINLMLLLAQRRFKLLSIVFPCSLGYLLAATTLPHSATMIIASAGIANMVAFIVTTIGILRTPVVNE